MDRRGFLKNILAAGVAPYVVTTAGVLMPVKQILRPTQILFEGNPKEPMLWFEGNPLTATELLRRQKEWEQAILFGNSTLKITRAGLPSAVWRHLETPDRQWFRLKLNDRS